MRSLSFPNDKKPPVVLSRPRLSVSFTLSSLSEFFKVAVEFAAEDRHSVCACYVTASLHCLPARSSLPEPGLEESEELQKEANQLTLRNPRERRRGASVIHLPPSLALTYLDLMVAVLITLDVCVLTAAWIKCIS